MLNKSDLLDDEELKNKQTDIIERLNWSGPVYTISAISKKGTEQLAFDIMQQLELAKEDEREAQQEAEIEVNCKNEQTDNRSSDT